jgi:hypothetical protein
LPRGGIARPAQPFVVNVDDPAALRYWMLKWRVTEQDLRQAVLQAGIAAGDVARTLGRSETLGR